MPSFCDLFINLTNVYKVNKLRIQSIIITVYNYQLFYSAK